MNPKNLQFWNWCAVFYVTFALLLLTLNPFKFQWLGAAQHFEWIFETRDIVQNLFLFFPLGVVLQHALQRHLILVVLYGALLSTTIEVIQLSDLGRTSNYCDIVTNVIGTFMGTLYYRYIVSLNPCKSTDIALAFMLMPLCWFIAMRSETQDKTAWLVMPIAVAALTIFKSSLSINRYKWITLAIWLMFSITPLIFISRENVVISLFHINLTSGIITLIAVLAAISGLSFFRIPNYHRLCFSLLFLTMISIIVVNLRWYLRNRAYMTWTVSTHLHWIDTLMGILLIIFAWLWLKHNHSTLK